MAQRGGPLLEAGLLRIAAAVALGFAFFHFVGALVSTLAHALGWLELTTRLGGREVGLSPVLINAVMLLAVLAVAAALLRRSS